MKYTMVNTETETRETIEFIINISQCTDPRIYIPCCFLPSHPYGHTFERE